MGPTEVRIVQSRAEFDAAIDCQWEGFTHPQEEFWSLWFPLDLVAHMGRSEKRADAVIESKNRLWNEHVSDPRSTWTYIADDNQKSADGKASYCIASCQWRIYEPPSNPFPNGMPDIRCVAWPPGSEGSEFAAKLARGIFKTRVQHFAKPHFGLSWMAVRPAARNQGLGSILMQWGIEQADRLGLEGFIEGSDLGRPLYEKNGFRQICETHPDISPNTDSDSVEWEALRKYYLPDGMHFHAMWRPAKGCWESVEEDWKDHFRLD